MFPHPKGKDTAGILSGWDFIVPADSAHHDATLKFVAFLMKPENQGFYTDTFPAAQSAMSMPRFQDPLLQPFKEALKYARPLPASPAWIRTTQIVYSSVQSIMLGQATPQAAMDSAAQQIDAALQQ